ncbi:MAG: hypothetical protein H0V53_03105 [Rubrobacter sp.]|nr:hypothetical protein [Rubrobacter sp.]
MVLERRGLLWAGVLFGIVMLAFVVPYTVLRGVDSPYGSFLFWVVFAAVAVVVNFLITRRWRD